MTQPETITDAVPSDSNIDNKETTVLSAADDSTTVNDIPKYNPIEGDAENEMESVEMLNALALSQSRIGDGLTSKHPLQCEWTLWFDSPSKKTNQTNWHDNVKQVYTFGTVEDFWALYNNIAPASKISTGSNYHLFKKGIWPAWEDDQNKKGGKWVATFPSNRQKLEDQWLYALLACIGETFDFSEQICGCVVSLRKQDRISLWTKEATDREACMAIGQHFKQILGIVDRIEYQAHDEAIVRNSSFRNRAIHSL